MGREIRRVAPGWKHPLRNGKDWPSDQFPTVETFRPQFESREPYIEMLRKYLAEYESWERGDHPSRRDSDGNLHAFPFHEWDGGPPDPDAQMPFWTDEERTHFQMYEDTSEGTPISPVCATREEVARWCADNGASIFGGDPAPYETWLRIAGGTPSLGLMISVKAP